LGAEVHGEVGEPDPVAAIKEVLGSHQVDEIILSTCRRKFKEGESPWQRMFVVRA
jgi:hypothetical protein